MYPRIGLLERVRANLEGTMWTTRIQISRLSESAANTQSLMRALKCWFTKIISASGTSADQRRRHSLTMYSVKAYSQLVSVANGQSGSFRPNPSVLLVSLRSNVALRLR
jgi:hypothetical protein